ncbi:MAG: DUF3306 domain-containing protein [Rhodocyclaceae bacterium]|nr:DUF3306 domain-containing protein [Rhodocyclaceae bacterium]
MSEAGFFSRWAKRKAQVATQTAGDGLPPTDSAAVDGSIASARQSDGIAEKRIVEKDCPTDRPSPLPSIESLTADSDFAPFMAKDVAPDMRNQAMKKLFTAPHFNVMDGLDIYIDDYSKPDPLPEGWLQRMNQSKSLRLFETVEEESARLGSDAAVPQQAPIAATAQPRGMIGADEIESASPDELDAKALPSAKPTNASSEHLLRDTPVAPTSVSKLTQT